MRFWDLMLTREKGALAQHVTSLLRVALLPTGSPRPGGSGVLLHPLLGPLPHPSRRLLDREARPTLPDLRATLSQRSPGALGPGAEGRGPLCGEEPLSPPPCRQPRPGRTQQTREPCSPGHGVLEEAGPWPSLDARRHGPCPPHRPCPACASRAATGLHAGAPTCGDHSLPTARARVPASLGHACDGH